MKFLFIVSLIAVAAGAALEIKPFPLLRYARNLKEDGSNKYSFASEDGIAVSASDSQNFVGPEPENVGVVSRGSYSYTPPEGTVITINWVADENGFQPSGAHLPVASPMPEHVVKLLADLRAAGKL